MYLADVYWASCIRHGWRRQEMMANSGRRNGPEKAYNSVCCHPMLNLFEHHSRHLDGKPWIKVI